jgi:tetratricopeptide (TPR) repeat protein
MSTQNRSSTLKKEDADFFTERAYDLYQAKSYENALGHYQLALRCDPDDLIAMHGQATSYYMVNDYEKAYDCYKALLVLEKKAVFYYEKALVLNKLNHLDRALQSLYAGLALDPSDKKIFRELLRLRIAHKSLLPYFRPYTSIL